MKFGIFYELQLPRPWGPDSEYNLYQDALSQLELADALGYDYAWEVEHHFLEEYSHSSAPEVLLSAAAALKLHQAHPAPATASSTADHANHLAKGGREGLGAGPDLQWPGRAGHGRRAPRSPSSPRSRCALRGQAGRSRGRRGALPDPDVRRRRGSNTTARTSTFPLRNVLPRPRQKPHLAAVDRLLAAADHRLRRREGHRRAGLPVRQRRRRPTPGSTPTTTPITKRLAKLAGHYPVVTPTSRWSRCSCALAPTRRRARRPTHASPSSSSACASTTAPIRAFQGPAPGEVDMWDRVQQVEGRQRRHQAERALSGGLIGSPETIRQESCASSSASHIDQVILSATGSRPQHPSGHRRQPGAVRRGGGCPNANATVLPRGLEGGRAGGEDGAGGDRDRKRSRTGMGPRR